METLEGVYEDESESFRDSIATVDKDGKRIWLYPKKPKGKFYNARTWLSILLLGILFGTPFIKIGGEPLLLLDVINRRFVIFGQIFWPQDSFLFALGLITIILFVVLFTVVYGRVFCGWICPQTIFMEMVFRKIEYWIEGDWKKQQKLDKMPWNNEKVIKKTSKQLIFFLISFLIANTFLAYFIGIEELITIVTDPPSEHLAGLFSIILFSGAFYFVFSRLREQVCTTICPYGRLQGVLLDKSSIVVAYDYVRGEKRSKWRKQEDREAEGKGDCIDCKQCVHVCPTGIDIRNGTQLECVNCTACIDACDDIMLRINKPTGLIKYASEEGIANNKPFRLTARIKGYTGVLVILVGVLVTLLLSRSDVETSILRTPGMLYQEQEDNKISNLYNIKMINKTNRDIPVELKLIESKGEIKLIGNNITLEKQGKAEQALFLIFNKDDITKTKTQVEIGVYSNGELIETVSTNFLGPVVIGNN
ncbi:cytochrome c oxidase accessory protein CcoG [Flexithrix dorotheae]|uniref:cytochrome c oxidase accessory protein CcoG n=1 Tax=Flexithrix dorotheae TaxID=70993 RepID=UPI0003733EDD|nr:cytochrome c oxidase accessory protein CcoG [Flexithrix dorotheae]